MQRHAKPEAAAEPPGSDFQMTLLLRGCASDAVAIMARAESLTVEGA